MPAEPVRGSCAVTWTRRHLLGLEDLSREEIVAILDTAEHFARRARSGRRERADLAGKVVVNLFFEPSTRTRTSFGLAAKPARRRHPRFHRRPAPA